ELPVDEGDVAILAADEERAEVPRPRAIGADPEEVYPAEVHPHTTENRPRLPLGAGVLHQDAHALAGHEMAHHLAVDPRDGRELPRPVTPLVRPGEPGGGVRLPFGRPAVAERGRRARPRCGRAHSSSRRLVMGA